MKAGNSRRAAGAYIALGLLAPIAGLSQTIIYTDFSSGSLAAHPMQINGSAHAPVSNGISDVLRLTPALSGQAGSAFSLNTIQLGGNASFSTAFSFQFTAGGGIGDGYRDDVRGADGVVFVLNTVSNSVGSSGSGVGYRGINHSVGIKFDTWWDRPGSFPLDNDPNGNFVAIYQNGSTNTSGLPYFTPSTLMKNGHVWYAWIDYNGVTHDIEVRLSDTASTRPASAILTRNINLSDASILGSSPNVYAGFTSGTGAAWNNHDILNWQFNSTYKPIDNVGDDPAVPDSAPTIGLLMASLIGLAAVRRRRGA